MTQPQSSECQEHELVMACVCHVKALMRIRTCKHAHMCAQTICMHAHVHM